MHRLKTYDDLFASHGKVECHFFQLKYEKIKEAHSNTEEDGIRYVLQFHWKVNVKLRRTMSGQYLKLQRTRSGRRGDSLLLLFPYFYNLIRYPQVSPFLRKYVINLKLIEIFYFCRLNHFYTRNP